MCFKSHNDKHKQWQSIIINKINQVLYIKCLYGGCPRVFLEEEIKSFIGDQVYMKYKKFKNSQIKLKNPSMNFINRPIPDCEDIIEINGDMKESPFLQCDLGHKFCAKCKTLGWHIKGKCKDV